MSGQRRIRIAVLAGGRSSERAISIASAQSVIGALDPERYEVLPVGIDAGGRWQLASGDGLQRLAAGEAGPAGKGTALVPGAGADAMVERSTGLPNGLGSVDVVFPVLHGPFGEDGTVQGLLETVGIPYVGAGVLGSAVAMDKDVCKAVLRNARIPVTPSLTFRDAEDEPDDPRLVTEVTQALGWPVFVKPASLGSSVGVTKVAGPADLPEALRLGFAHDPKVLVEQFVPGRELECGVLGNDRPVASAVGEIRPNADWYDYAAKYDEGGSEIDVPADVDEDVAERVRELALRAFRACEASGMARVDFFLRPGGEILLNEVNTIPGFTLTSVYARLFAARGIDYGELIDQAAQLALERHAQRGRYRY